MTAVADLTTWKMPVDAEAAAFFADARASLTRNASASPAPAPAVTAPAGWPTTPGHSGNTITPAELRAHRSHATRISFDWDGSRHAMWVGKLRSSGWSVLAGNVGQPASAPVSTYHWHTAVARLNEYIAGGRAFGGSNLTVDTWVPEFTTLCLAHGDDCIEHDIGHNFVQRRTLPRHPDGVYRTCGGGDHDGDYRYRFQVHGRWWQRFGCRSHHPGLLNRFLGEADGTVTVRLMNDHIDGPQATAV